MIQDRPDAMIVTQLVWNSAHQLLIVELAANARLPALLLALFRPRAMSDLSPECAPKRTSAGRSNLWVARSARGPSASAAWFAARALEDPERYAGRVIQLAGDELSVGDIIRTFKTVIGRKPWVAPIPTFVAKMMMPKEFADMFRWIREKGFKANIAEVRQEYPQLLTFADWLKKYSDEH
jgi:hypothetical protein